MSELMKRPLRPEVVQDRLGEDERARDATRAHRATVTLAIDERVMHRSEGDREQLAELVGGLRPHRHRRPHLP